MLHSSVIGSDESLSDEAISPSHCLLFRASYDSIISILSYLSMGKLCRLDIAVTNTALRVIWLGILRGKNHCTINYHKHNHESIRWLIARGISPERLEASYDTDITGKINGRTLLDLDISSLRNISLWNSKIGDEEVSLVAHGCPKLTEISLLNCHDITDASMIALARCYRQLIFIDIGGCCNITDIGLIAYADACCNVSNAANDPEMGNASALRRISLSRCKRITDIGLSALGRGCPLLCDINLDFSSNITDIGILALAEGCSLLSIISLYGCKNITDVVYQLLVGAVPC